MSRIICRVDRSEFDGIDWSIGPVVWFTRDHNCNGPCWGIGIFVGPWQLYIGSENQ